ncbi:hypothetical protein [Psychrobacillus sp. L4]|uniref:hypothetical protein n=1 Tax=Psychrobacillus sp. L4 TaxID=3236892 RepID=UPI0036F3F0B4
MNFHLIQLKRISAGEIPLFVIEDKQLMQSNSFAIELLAKGPSPQPFPKSVTTAPGSEEEAQIIYTLLYNLR